MNKKELEDEGLKNVSGGADGFRRITCPNCGNCQDECLFNPQKIGSGCGEEIQFTCSQCNHVFIE